MNFAEKIGNHWFCCTEYGLLGMTKNLFCRCHGCISFHLGRFPVEGDGCVFDAEGNAPCLRNGNIWVSKKGFFLLKNERDLNARQF